MQNKPARYRHTTQKEMIYELWETMVGGTEKEGFIHEMRAFKRDTECKLEKLDRKIHDTKNDVKPIITIFSSWKMIAGFISGFIGLIAAIVYIIVHLK